MSSEWVKNFAGVQLDDDQMQIIPRPMTELTAHVTIKTVQAGGLLGTMVVGPLVAAAKKDSRNWAGVQQQMTRKGRGGVIIGLVLGPILTAVTMRNQSAERIYDRCYRLRYNRNQVRVDQASVAGALCGTAVGMATGTAMFGGLIGLSSGILLAAVYNSSVKKE